MTWAALDPDAGGAARRAIADLAGVLVAADHPPAGFASPDPSGLAYGDAGIALFLAYAADAVPSVDLAGAAAARLARAVAAVATVAMPPHLMSGFPGIAWAAEHLAGSPEIDVNAEIDRRLLAFVRTRADEQPYDLVQGLVGLAVYALERGERPSARALLEAVVEALGRRAEPARVGLQWSTPADLLPGWQRADCPDGYVNLGLAHGMPGVVAVLARAVERDVAGDRALALLRGAVECLEDEALGPGLGARYPMWRAGSREAAPARAAWCYGDPGVVAALLGAARRTGESAWAGLALELAHGVARRPVEACGVWDPGICHGAAGLVHLLNRVYQATGDEVVGAAGRDWLTRLLAMRGDAGVAGFAARNPDDQGRLRLEPDPGLLVGAAGVGLVLLAAIGEVVPSWDRCLLLDVEPEP